jgi:hypothetical protein
MRLRTFRWYALFSRHQVAPGASGGAAVRGWVVVHGRIWLLYGLAASPASGRWGGR